MMFERDPGQSRRMASIDQADARRRPATSAVARFARLALTVEPVSDRGLFAQSIPPPRAVPEDTDSCPPVLLGWPST